MMMSNHVKSVEYLTKMKNCCNSLRQVRGLEVSLFVKVSLKCDCGHKFFFFLNCAIELCYS